MHRRKKYPIASLVFVLGAGLAACSSTTPTTNPTSSSTPAATNATLPANPDLLAAAGDTAQHHPVDDISCQASEQVLFHIHAHLAVLVNGRQRYLPYGVGIGPPLQLQPNAGETGGPFVVGGSCFSWLHTHDESGIIHIESPIKRTYTLGNFFDIWGQPLGADQVGAARGTVHAFVDGKPFAANPRSIPLDAHAVIQLDVGSPVVAPEPFTFPPGL